MAPAQNAPRGSLPAAHARLRGGGYTKGRPPQLCSSLLARLRVVSQASRIFPSGVRMRVNKFCVGGEGKIRLVTVARFSCRLPKIW